MADPAVDAVADVSCTWASSAELLSQCGAKASQNITSPVVTGDPPEVTVAVSVIGVLYGTLFEEIVSVVKVGNGAVCEEATAVIKKKSNPKK